MTNTQKNYERKSRTLKIADITVKVILMILLVSYCISLLIPLIWMLLTSFKDGFLEYNTNPFGFPKHIVWENYTSVLEQLKIPVFKEGVGTVEYGIDSMLVYSLIYAVVLPIYVTLMTTLVAYVMSKYRFFGCEFLYGLGLFVMITPIIGNMAAVMSLRKAWGIYDNMFLTILTSPTCVFSGLNFMLLYALFKGIPWTYAEAVFIDGGSDFTALFKVMLPMALPTCTALFILGFLGCWNDYATFLIWLPSYPNLAYGMYYFQNAQAQFGATMPEIMAGFVIVVIPASFIFIVSQKLVLSKFTVGGLKG